MASPATTDYAEIQDNEIQALQSIYMESFELKESKPGAWNKSPDKEFSLRLGFSDAIAEDVLKDTLITMNVGFPHTYPKTVPRIRLDFHPILSKRVRSQLTQLVRDKPKELLGSELIFELASSVQEVLDDAAPDIARAQEVPALAKERDAYEAQTQQQAEHEREVQDMKQKAIDEEEQRALSEMVQAERSRLAKIRERSRRSSSGSRSSMPQAEHLSSFDQEIKFKDSKSSAVVAFRSVTGKSKYRKGPITNVFTTEPVIDETNGEDYEIILALKECTTNADKKAVQSLESRLELLLKLPQHANVMRLLGFRIHKQPQPSLKWSISILMPFADGRSLRDLLKTITTVDVTNMRAWIIQILEGLHFLHQNHIVMARLSLDNILLDGSDTGKTIVKLADAGFQQDLHVIYHNGPEKFSSAASSYWSAPELDRSQAKLMPSLDIWYLGVVLLQSLFGLDVQSQYNAPSQLVNTVELSESLENLLRSVFAPDPKKRPSAFELLPNEFLRNDDPVLETAVDASGNDLSPMLSHTSHRHLPSRSVSGPAATISRYASDFVEYGKLGKGGFGEVVRARNKLDGTTYAIKKITQTSTAELSGVLSEVMLLSRLNHPNIVRYYTAWVEEEGTGNALLRQLEDGSSDEEGEFSRFERSNTQGLDFISSSAMGGIEFGYDTDEDSEAVDEENEGNEDCSPDAGKLQPAFTRQRRRSSTSSVAKVTLYIQMEYCEKQTLRDLLRDLYTDVEQCWRLFRQVLSALAYIHAEGVLHRDLKPDNIFITADETDQPRIRLGDFGLARPGGSTRMAPSSGSADPNLTASIGTSLYVAPEVRSSSGGSYNDKADMFSLGIILFEMSHPLKTAMERAEVLTALRRPSFQFPEEFEDSEKQIQAEIIRSLVKPKPSERPSSQDLLANGRIPSHVEDEAVKAALQSLSDKTSPFFSKLMDGLFSQGTEERNAKSLTYDLDLNLLAPEVDTLLLQSMVHEHLRAVFARHGAVEVQRQYLLPSSDMYDASVRLLDPSGTVIQLPYDLTIPHARSVAKQTKVVRKSFSFGHVFRQAPPGVHPRAHGEFDFDIVTEDSLDLALREAEVLKVIDEIIDEIPALSSVPVAYHITHSRLIEAIFSICGIPHQDVVMQVISRLNIGQWTWTKIRSELRGLAAGISSTSLDDLQKFDFREPYETAIPRLRTLLQSQADDLEPTFRHLEAVTAYMSRFNISKKVYIHPLGSINERFYRGNVLFQCILDVKKKKVICAGGRYDALIQEFRAGSKFNRHAVGFNFAWDNLVDSMAQWLRPVGGKQFLKKSAEAEDASDTQWRPRRCDILVDSTDPATLRTAGISIVQELWANDIRAELVVDSPFRESASLQQGNRDEAGSYDWIVLAKQDGSLKVRSNVRKEDIELRRAELLGWLRGELRERDRTQTAGTRSGAGTASHAHHDAGGTDTREPSINILVAQHRSKKTNRRMVVDDALSRTAAAMSGFRSATIAAVELKDELFDGIRETRLADPESWRRFVHSAPPGERQYIGQIHEMLERVKANGECTAWLYNFRSKNCFLYDLGKTV